MNRIQSNQNKLSEIEKTLAIIETEEEGIKKRIEVYEEQLKTKFTDLENKIVLLFQLMEEKNAKIANLESSLKEISVLMTTKNNTKNGTLENPLKFKCKMCDFQSSTSGGLKITHLTL